MGRIVNDISGLVFNKYLYYFSQIRRRIIWTIFFKTVLFFKGIRIGARCRFYGKAFFYRYPGSKIIIGVNCGFRSYYNSNLIGINHPCILATHLKDAELLIGNNCGFSGTTIGAFKSIKIGDNVKCGANTLITDGDWHPNDFRSHEPKEVLIGDNVWIGEGAKILKGASIGQNSVIGAGSIVTSNIPSNVVAAGNPCKVIKTL